MKSKFIITSAIVALFVSNLTMAEQNKPSTTESILVEQQLEVLEINKDERWVMLKDRSGFTKKVEVGEGARNFDQLKVGDLINVNYAETIQIKAFGKDAINMGEEAEAIFARTPEGAKPGGALAAAKTIVVTISNIDLKHNLVTLKDKQGNTRTFRPEIPGKLKQVKVGDKVAISVAKAMSISVDDDKK